MKPDLNSNTVTKLISEIETYMRRYVTFTDNNYTLPLALWVVGTYIFNSFDSFPYLVITSTTKRSGKTRCAEVLSFACKSPEQFSAMTPAGLFYCIEERSPTIFFDEAEVLSSEAANNMRAVLNIGYRRGQTVPRLVAEYWSEEIAGYTKIKNFKTYCPKVFILIGDVYDTLKDRSIVVRMKRDKPQERFVYDEAKELGNSLGVKIRAWCTKNEEEISNQFRDHEQIEYLTDRNAEIWTPLFCLANLLCKERLTELARIAVDMSQEKTAEAEKYINLLGSEKKAEQDEYAERLLYDLRSLYSSILHNGIKTAIPTMQAIELLKAIPTSPWRKFRGEGLTPHSMSDMLQVYGVSPVSCRNGRNVFKGYRLADVRRAMEKIGTTQARS